MRNRVRPLTERQAEVLEYIRQFIRENGYAPSVNEIAKRFGVLYNAANDYLVGLEKKKAIRRTPRVARSIVIVDGN